LADAWFRLQLLQEVTQKLASAHTAAEIGAIVTAVATEQLGALSALVMVLGADDVLRSVASSGGRPAGADRYDELPLDADLPGGEAMRTGETIVLHGIAAIAARYPALGRVYDRDRSLYVAPLVVGDHRLGVLSLNFPADGSLGEESQGAFVGALADALAQALERVLALAQAAEANERLSFLADASIALSATLDYQATVDAVTQLLVPRLADWCLVQVLDDGELRTVGLQHTDKDKITWAEQISSRYPTRMDEATGAPNVVRTGVSEIYPELPDELIEAAAIDADHLAIIKQVGMSSVLIAPLTGRTGTFGVVTLIYAESGRRYSNVDLQFVEDVTRRAALALENARAFREQAGLLADVNQVNARLALLTALSSHMTGVGTQAEVFERLTRVVVPAIADWATVVVPQQDELVRIAAAHRDPVLDGLAKRLVGTYPHSFSGPSPGVVVYRSSEPLRLPFLAQHIANDLDDSTASAAYGRTLKLLGDGPGLIVPVIAGGAVVAVLTLSRSERGPFTDADVELMVEVAEQISARLTDARDHEAQREAAAALQEAALPKTLPNSDRLQISAGYRPASEGGQVGGDWYDAIELSSGRIALVVGDAAGHGLQAAAVMTQLRNALRAHLSAGLGPSEALSNVSSFFATQEPDVFATILCVDVDPQTGQLIWASAGHPAPIIVDPNGKSVHLQGRPAPPIGWPHDAQKKDHHFVLQPGARLLMFSDGLVERRAVDLDIGLTHLMFLAEQTSRTRPPAAVCDIILGQMLTQAHDDDVCLLIADFAGTPLQV
jgi:serine phosphatase RsbU (regulator of sigma subunit)